MYNRIKEDLKAAMMAQDKFGTYTLRMVLAALNNEIISKCQGTQLSDSDCEVALKRLIRQRQDSAEQFTQGGALEKAQLENAEIQLIETYLPQQMTEEQLGFAIDHTILTLSTATVDFQPVKKHMGSVMKLLKETHGNSFDAKLASQMVQARLV